MNDHADTPSSKRLDLLPPPDELERRCMALALLEAGLNPNASTRWHRFARSGDARTCIVDDGGGNEARYWFGEDGAVVRGFDHESPLTPWAREPMEVWPGMYDGAPPFVGDAPTIEIAGIESVTFCLWWTEGGWRRGPVELALSAYLDPDGSAYLLKPIAAPSEATEFLTTYYERPVPGELATALFATTRLSGELIDQLAIESPPADVEAEATAIGYVIESPR